MPTLYCRFVSKIFGGVVSLVCSGCLECAGSRPFRMFSLGSRMSVSDRVLSLQGERLFGIGVLSLRS